MVQDIKISDWLCIAQEGKTIDGREIKREWIESAARNYSIDLYTSLIWCEHEDPYWRQFGNNLGIVEELKTEEKDGKLRLMARLRANGFLQYLNEQEQKIYSSIELLPDFPNEGEHYLVGLAATDQPASTGLSRITFSNPTGKTTLVSESILLFNNKPNVKTKAKSFFDRFKFTKKENFTMEPEEIEKLQSDLAQAKADNETLQAKINELTEQLKAGDIPAAQTTIEEIKTKAEETGESIESAESNAGNTELSLIKKQNEDLKKRLGELENKFNVAQSTSVTSKPGIGINNTNFEFH